MQLTQLAPFLERDVDSKPTTQGRRFFGELNPPAHGAVQGNPRITGLEYHEGQLEPPGVRGAGWLDADGMAQGQTNGTILG